MLFEVLGTARDIGRLHEIAMVLVRHGLGDAVRRMGLGRILERAGRALHWEAAQGLAQKPPERHVREALEELGPTFVKVGQILAGRRDLLPPSWTDELARLQEEAAPEPWEAVRAQLAEDLGAPPEEVFQDFQVEPFAAASIAQVHRARLSDATAVAVKVRRPGIAETVDADLRLLARLAELAERELPELRSYQPRGFVRRFARTLRDELDMRIEARNARHMARDLGPESPVVVPAIHDDYTHERVVVMDWVEGQSVGRWIREGTPGPVDPRWVARVGAEAALKMIFLDGFFHADPHPGNVVLTPKGRVALLDFGMVGRLQESRRIEFLELLDATYGQRIDDVVDILLDWTGEGSAPDIDALSQDCEALIGRYGHLALRDLDTTALLSDIASILRENGLALPPDVALLLKVFVTLDAFGLALDPDFQMAPLALPFTEQAMRRYRSPRRMARRGLRELRSIAARAPKDARRLIASLRRGQVKLAVDLDHLDAFGRQLERSANRITIGLIASALIVGTAITLNVTSSFEVLGMPVLALLGFLASLAVGVALLWMIFRSARRS